MSSKAAEWDLAVIGGDRVGHRRAERIARLQGGAHFVGGHGNVVFVQLHVEHLGHVAFDLFRPAP